MKKLLHQKCLEIIESKLLVIQQNIDAAQQTANEDTKSSAGDKYETTRAMMQIEIENNTKRLIEVRELKKILTQIIFQNNYQFVVVGSLVMTNQGKFFISIGLGQVFLENDKYFVVSINSPIGALLLGKKINDTIIFHQKEYQILDIL
ncbi:MAG: 3-oxoacyl-ACP synthase [Cytophagia bacterium]|nr:MAG: 3-oxoacyl-ACP synthase [Cytophagia bacterium]TAG43314.1 MAG: 3-oxoacyl-ACP synthase [Cytophagia bacterium]